MYLKSIRKYCIYCSNNQPNEIRICPSKECLFYNYRFSKREPLAKNTPLKQIRKFCLKYSSESAKNVKECPFNDCPLFKYRFGKNPALKGKKGNPEALKSTLLVKNHKYNNRFRD